MEIFVIVYLTNTDLVISSINESLGSFIALHIGAIVHSLIGAILCKIAKIKWLSYIPAVISAIVAIYSFFFALGDLEGFFITIKVDNSIKDKYHQELIKENIFTVQVNEGIRVAVCSLPINKCYGLSKRLKDILDKVKG
jgi:hypothetical protein